MAVLANCSVLESTLETCRVATSAAVKRWRGQSTENEGQSTGNEGESAGNEGGKRRKPGAAECEVVSRLPSAASKHFQRARPSLVWKVPTKPGTLSQP